MLKEMTVVQLKEMLRERGLKVSGRKAELIERIEQFDEAIENYNTTEDILVGYGAMYDYINRNISEEVIGATGGDFLRSRIEDVLLGDRNQDLISYIVADVESLLDFYIYGGNEHTKAEINEVKEFYEFLKNLARHTDVRIVSDVWESPLEDEEDVAPAQEPIIDTEVMNDEEFAETVIELLDKGELEIEHDNYELHPSNARSIFHNISESDVESYGDERLGDLKIVYPEHEHVTVLRETANDIMRPLDERREALDDLEYILSSNDLGDIYDYYAKPNVYMNGKGWVLV